MQMASQNTNLVADLWVRHAFALLAVHTREIFWHSQMNWEVMEEK